MGEEVAVVSSAMVGRDAKSVVTAEMLPTNEISTRSQSTNTLELERRDEGIN